MTSPTQFLMIWAWRLAKFWFIPFFLMLVLAYFFFRGESFKGWWRRWSAGAWVARDWHKKDRKRLLKAWELRPAWPVSDVARSETTVPAKRKPDTLARWEQGPSVAGVMNSSESAALATTNDHDLKNWLLERMISSKQRRRDQTSSLMTTILLGAGHIFLGLVVLLVAISIFGSLLEVIYGLSGGRP